MALQLDPSYEPTVEAKTVNKTVNPSQGLHRSNEAFKGFHSDNDPYSEARQRTIDNHNHVWTVAHFLTSSYRRSTSYRGSALVGRTREDTHTQMPRDIAFAPG